MVIKPKHFQTKDKEVEELPSSSDERFWPKRSTKVFPKPQPRRVKEHYPIVKRGPYFICTGCPNEHTISVDPKKFTVKDGRLVPLDKT